MNATLVVLSTTYSHFTLHLTKTSSQSTQQQHHRNLCKKNFVTATPWLSPDTSPSSAMLPTVLLAPLVGWMKSSRKGMINAFGSDGKRAREDEWLEMLKINFLFLLKIRCYYFHVSLFLLALVHSFSSDLEAISRFSDNSNYFFWRNNLCLASSRSLFASATINLIAVVCECLKSDHVKETTMMPFSTCKNVFSVRLQCLCLHQKAA